MTQGLRKKLLPTLKSSRRIGAVGRWHGERVLVELHHRGVTAREGFAGLGLLEARGFVAAGSQKHGQQRKKRRNDGRIGDTCGALD